MSEITKSIGRYLMDRVRVLETIYAYARYADTLQPARMTSLFTDNCYVQFTPDGSDALRSPEKLRKFLETRMDRIVSQSHHISNEEVLFEGPDTAVAHVYMQSWQRFAGYPAVPDLHIWGRYEIRFVRVNQNNWKMTHMLFNVAGTQGGSRIREQVERPWPPRFTEINDMAGPNLL